MHNYIWILLCGLCGLSGYWIGRKSNEKRMREELRKEVHGLKTYYRKELEEKEKEYREQFAEAGFIFEKKGDVDLRDQSSMHPSIIPEYDPPCKPDMPLAGDFDGDPLVDQTPGGQQHRMVANMQERNSIAKRYQEQDFKDMDRDQAEEEYPAEEEIDPSCPPYVISEEEFAEERNWYSKLQYEFYQGDQALVNECDEIVLNWEEEIGIDAMAILLSMSVSKDVGEVFVRNDVDGTDYDILVFPGKASDKELMPRNEEDHEEFAISGGEKK